MSQPMTPAILCNVRPPNKLCDVRNACTFMGLLINAIAQARSHQHATQGLLAC